jgi:hypothetical protein
MYFARFADSKNHFQLLSVKQKNQKIRKGNLPLVLHFYFDTFS